MAARKIRRIINWKTKEGLSMSRILPFDSRFAQAILLTLVLANLCCTIDAGDAAPALAELRADFLGARTGTPKGAAAQRLFAEASVQDIQRLCFDEDNSIAFCAAWRRLEVQMAAKFVGPDRAAAIVDIPSTLSREFLGFVEGRLRVPTPDAWTQNLLSAQHTRWGATLFLSSGVYSPYDRPNGDLAYQMGRGRSALPRVSLTLDGDGLIPYATFVGREAYEGRDAVAHLPDAVVNQLKSERERRGRLSVTGIAIGDRAVIAAPGDGPGQGELICMVTRGSKGHPAVLWRSTMDSYWANHFKGGEWFTEFRVKEDLLYLFHCTHDSIGIECISVVDGARIFSFNSGVPRR